MSLLTDLMEHSLDEGYALTAARRAEQPQAGHRRTPSRQSVSVLLLAGMLAIGLLLSIAAIQTRDRAPAAAGERTALTREIEQRTSSNDELAAQLDRQRAAVAAARRHALRLTADGAALSRALTRLEAITGAVAVTGPALVVHLEDASETGGDGADVDPRTDEASEGRVTDRDLQTVVNEVWAAGAEAVAVNGQRLTTVSAIRSAGDAVLVDFRPLSPPYDIVGVGNAHGMQTTFAEGFGASYLQALRDYGISYSISTKDSVRLSASDGLTLHYAHSPARSETPR